MVGSHKASGVLLVLLVVMATTIANGTPVVDTAKNAATAVEDTAKNAATAVGGAAASVGAKVSGAKPGAAVDVKASGAKGDSKTDDSAAFAAAWKEACAAGSTITVPKGEYMVESLEFKGPCKGPVTLELNGNFKAPATVKTTKPHAGWIDFENIADFT